MRKTIFALLWSIPFLTFSQNTTDDILQIIKKDDVGAFVKYLDDGHDINDCYEIKQSSYNVLILSIKYDSKRIFRKCMALKADEEKVCNDKTPLMYAVKYNRIDFCEALIIRGVNRYVMTEEGTTAYDHARRYGRRDFLPMLE